jgi:hypothetical protein
LSASCSQFATRRAYGVALAKLGEASKRVVAMDSSWDTLDKGENKHNTQP